MANPYELTPHIAIASAPVIGDVTLLIEKIGGWPRVSVIFAFIAYMVVVLISCLRPQPRPPESNLRARDQVFLLDYEPTR
jgi:hypothetical protein